MSAVTSSFLAKEYAAATTPKLLGLALSLTEQCNFRCTYCYESFELKAMPDETFGRLKQFARKHLPGLMRFELNWFGGEPLLEWQRMAEFSGLCKSVCLENGVDMPPASVPTNAWALTPQVMRELCDAGVGVYMISLDGRGEVHDRTRKTAAGHGTFDRIYRNLIDLRDSETSFEVILRLHLHQDNLESQQQLAVDLRRDFGDDRRFTFDPVGLGNFGGPTVHLLRLLKGPDADSASDALESALGRRRPRAQGEHVCYAAKPNRIFIRPDGGVYKCTSALNRADNRVGTLLTDGSIDVDKGRVQSWGFGFGTGDGEHLACPLKYKDNEHVVRFTYKDRRVGA